MTEEKKDIPDLNAGSSVPGEGGGPPAEGKGPAPASERVNGSASGVKAESDAVVAGLLERVARLEAENAELRDKTLRTMAEMENIRRRTEREKTDVSKYAISRFAADMAGVADNIRRAIEATPQEALNANPALRSLYEGIEVTEREMMNVLERHGMKRIDPRNEKFDPNFHQAMFEEESPDIPPGNVVRVMQAGFMIEDRLLRPALVSVAKVWSGPRPEARPAPEAPRETLDATLPGTPSETPHEAQGTGGSVETAAFAEAARVSEPAVVTVEPRSQSGSGARPEWTAPRQARPNPSRHAVTEVRRPVEGHSRPRVAVEPSPFASSQRPQPPADSGAPTSRTSTLHQPVISHRPGPRRS